MDHDSHPFLKALRGKCRHDWLFSGMLLDEVVLATHFAVYLGERCIWQFSENRCKTINKRKAVAFRVLLTLPWIYLILQFHLFIESGHFQGTDDETLLWFVVLNLLPKLELMKV